MFTKPAFAFLLFTFAFAIPGASAQSWELVWADEFEGATLNPDNWSLQLGDGCPNLCGWGNNELEWYTNNNHTVSDGFLTITARKENVSGKNYTSTRMRTLGKGDWTYGRLEIRAKLPTGQGIWPAIWMLPSDPSIYGTWAASGEIDIMEMVGNNPDEVLGTIHYGGAWPQNQSAGNSFTLPNATFNDDFHVFSFEWEKTAMRWYVDGQLFSTQTSWSSASAAYPAPFDVDFHLLLNLAVGGNWPGSPDATTVFPQNFIIDYVRVYKNTEDIGEVQQDLIFDDMEHGNPGGNAWFSFNGSEGGGGISSNNTDLPPTVGGNFSLEAGFGGSTGFFGGFGRTNRLNLKNATHFNFWINPDAGQHYKLEINLQDDDNGDEIIPDPSTVDDEYQFDCVIGDAGPCAFAGGGWQLVSIPLSDFFDDNSFHTGGNAIFDPVPVSAGGNGQLINIVIAVLGEGTDVNFRTDNWAFVDSTQATPTLPLETPQAVHLTKAYPNPFQSRASFNLTLDQPQRVTVEVFDLLGRRVDAIFDGFLAGIEKYNFEFEAGGWPSGVYLYQVTGETFAVTERVVLIR